MKDQQAIVNLRISQHFHAVRQLHVSLNNLQSRRIRRAGLACEGR